MRVGRLVVAIHDEMKRSGLKKIDTSEIVRKLNEVESDIFYLTNVDVGLPLCDNAVIQGVVCKYLPDRLPLYQEQIKIIRLNAYKNDEPEDTQDGRIIAIVKDVLSRADLPKMNDFELYKYIKLAKQEVIDYTNVAESVNVMPEFCDNAIANRVIANYLPDYLKLFQENLLVIKSKN